MAALPLYDAPATGDAEKRQIEAWVAEAVRKLPDAIGLATNLGVIWIFQGRFDEAEALYRRVLRGNPENSDALNGLAWLLALRDRSQAEEALGLINKAVDIYGPNPTLVDTMAVALIRANHLDQAIEQLTQALKRAPERASLALHLAWAHEVKGQRDQARGQFLKAEGLGLKIQALDPLERPIVQELRGHLFPG
jgi:tetratricopeptide (TPR) repeat protein